MAANLCALIIICLASQILANNEDPVALRMKRSLADEITKKNWTVTTIEARPYIMLDNGVFTGFIPDLLSKISARLGIKFNLRLVVDGKYGSYNNSTKQWNGMIGELIKMEKGEPGGADLAAAAITITSGREKVVNFIKPFANLGLTIIIKKPDPPTLPTYIMFSGLAMEIWITGFVAMVVVSFILWLMNRYNPYEWGGRFNIGRATQEQAEAFNITGVLWMTFSTLQWQGYHQSPRSAASRILIAVWFMFVTISLSAYTASLASNIFYYSVGGGSGKSSSIKDLEHLVSQDKIKYGTIQSGSTYTYLTSGSGSEFDRIRAYFKSNPNVLVSSTKEGIEKTRKEQYAFIAESLTAKYLVNISPCDLMTTGEQFGQRSYGIALPHNTDINTMEAFHAIILELKEERVLEDLERKWWESKGECWLQNMKDRDALKTVSLSLPNQVGMDMFWPVIALLAAGSLVAIFVGVAEILYFRFRGKFADSNRPHDSQLTEVQG